MDIKTGIHEPTIILPWWINFRNGPVEIPGLTRTWMFFHADREHLKDTDHE